MDKQFDNGQYFLVGSSLINMHLSFIYQCILLSLDLGMVILLNCSSLMMNDGLNPRCVGCGAGRGVFTNHVRPDSQYSVILCFSYIDLFVAACVK